MKIRKYNIPGLETALSYNEVGQQVSIKLQLKYNEFEVLEFPPSCNKCPIGFSSSGYCGRNIPFLPEDSYDRPSTCKLHKVNLVDKIRQLLEGE